MIFYSPLNHNGSRNEEKLEDSKIKRTNIYLQTMTQKTKDWATGTPLKTVSRIISRCGNAEELEKAMYLILYFNKNKIIELRQYKQTKISSHLHFLLGTDHLTCRGGGRIMVFCFVQNWIFFSDNRGVRIFIFFVGQSAKFLSRI